MHYFSKLYQFKYINYNGNDRIALRKNRVNKLSLSSRRKVVNMKNKQLILLILSVILTIVCIGTLIFGIYTRNGLLIWTFCFLSISSLIQSIIINKRYNKTRLYHNL
jgi:hypothetical protein